MLMTFQRSQPKKSAVEEEQLTGILRDDRQEVLEASLALEINTTSLALDVGWKANALFYTTGFVVRKLFKQVNRDTGVSSRQEATKLIQFRNQ